MSLKNWLQRRTPATPGLTADLMSALVKARAIAGPYQAGTSFRDYARRFIAKVTDGDYRTIAGARMTDMTVAEMRILREAAE
jgi:hypothetical protein